MSNNLLEVKNLKKSFGGLQAVDIKELKFKKNQLTSIIGPNGAGKTTFFDLISGFQTADSGDIFLNGIFEPSAIIFINLICEKL